MRNKQPSIHEQMDNIYHALSDKEKIATLESWCGEFWGSFERLIAQRNALLEVAIAQVDLLYWQEVQTATPAHARAGEWDRIVALAAITGQDPHELHRRMNELRPGPTKT